MDMEHNGERMERSDESDARKRDTPRGVGATRPCVAAADTTGMPERRKGVDVVRPCRRHGSRPSRMAGKEGQRRKAAEHYDRIGHEPQLGASEANGQPQRSKTGGLPAQREKKRKSRRRARKRKRRGGRPAPRGREAWTRAEVADLPIRAKKRRVWAWKRHRRNVRRKERGKLDPDLATVAKRPNANAPTRIR